MAAAASLREGSASLPGPSRSGCQLQTGNAIFHLILARSGLSAGPQGCAPPALLRITAKYVLFLRLCQRWDYFWSDGSCSAELWGYLRPRWGPPAAASHIWMQLEHPDVQSSASR